MANVIRYEAAFSADHTRFLLQTSASAMDARSTATSLINIIPGTQPTWLRT